MAANLKYKMAAKLNLNFKFEIFKFFEPFFDF